MPLATVWRGLPIFGRRAGGGVRCPKERLAARDDGQIREVILDLEADKGQQERMLQFSVAETFKYYVEGFVPLKRYQIARPRRSAVELTHYLLKQAGQR